MKIDYSHEKNAFFLSLESLTGLPNLHVWDLKRLHPAAAKPKKDEEKRKETVEKEKKKENVKVQVHSVPNDAQMAAQKLNEPPKYPPPPPPSDVNDEIKTVNIELVNFFFFKK